MTFKEKAPTESDIYTLYAFYRQYKQYYEYYWIHQSLNTINKEDIEDYKKSLIKNRKKIGTAIDALCFFAQVSKDEIKNKNEIEVLDMIMEANYGETND